MAYDQPFFQDSVTVAVTGTSVVAYHQAHSLYNESLLDIFANVTTAFVGTTTPGKLEVGTAADPDKYGILYFGTAATPSPVNVALRASTEANGSLVLRENTIPAGSQVKITYTQGTGGTPAGVASAKVVFGVKT